MSRESLAISVDHSYPAVHCWETGLRTPRLPVVFRLAEVLGCNVTDLFEDAADLEAVR